MTPAAAPSPAFFHAHSERCRHDHREHRIGALADIRGAGHQSDSAVPVDIDMTR